MADLWSALLDERKAQWDALRERGPVVKIGDRYHLTRREDIVAALHNPDVFSSSLRGGGNGFDLVNLTLITSLDPPHHEPYRGILRPLFSAEAVRGLVPEMTRQAGEWVGLVADKGEFDAITLVNHYGVHSWHTILGLPVEDAWQLFEWHSRWALPHDSVEYLEAIFLLFAYMSRAVAEFRRNPGMPGLIPKAVAALNDKDAVGMAYTLYGAGGANELIALGVAFLALACDPQLQQLLRDDPGQTDKFIDEILRVESPLQSGLERVTTRDFTIGDVIIPAGSEVRLAVGAINIEDNNGISAVDGQITRCRHWSFGAGMHGCPAVGLVKAQMIVLINEFLRRIPAFEVAPGYVLPSIPERFALVLPTLPLRWGQLGH